MPFATPPMKVEVGSASRTRPTPTNSMIHVAVGAHLASATQSHKQRFDVGAGWVFGHDFADEMPSSAHGFYLDGSWFIHRRRASRTSIGARGQVLWAPEGGQVGGVMRVEHEWFTAVDKPFSSSGRCGVASGVHVGTAAVGFFTEAGAMRLPSGEAAWTATAGVVFRLPSAIGVAIGIPGCK